MPVTIVGNNTPTAGGVVYGDGTNYASTAAGTSGQVLTSNGASAPTWNAPAAVNLATGVTGTLPVANGGTGSTTLTANNVLLGNGTSAFQVVAPGTNGNVLTSNGTTWTSTAPAGGGSWVYLSTVAASGSSTADIENTFNSTYDAYVIVGSGIYNTDNGGFYARLKVGGAYVTSVSYSYIVDESNGTSTTPSYAAVGNNGNNIIKIGSLAGFGATRPCQVYIYVTTPSANAMPSIFWVGDTVNGTGAAQRMNGSGYLSTQGVLTGVRLYPQIGTFTGTFRLYGIKNS